VIVKLLKEDYSTPAELYRDRQEYEITRRLNLEKTIKAYELLKVEAAILSSHLGEMKKLADLVLQQATSLLNKVKVYEVKIQAYTAQNKPFVS